MQFEVAESMFKRDQIRELAETPDGLRYLKLRSMSRKEHLHSLFDLAGQDWTSKSKTELFRWAFENHKISDSQIESAIRSIYEKERANRAAHEPALLEQLDKVMALDWGGLHQNSLEKTIVKNYVNKISNFETLNLRIENELFQSLRGYVLCSWYNHWTSIIIEDIFRDHKKVLPAVGKVKKIDFFIGEVPFDLKVTYMPEGYFEDQRKRAGLKPELTLLKKVARDKGVDFDKKAKPAALLEDLWNKVGDHPETQSLMDFRVKTLTDSKTDPKSLIRWLYENQGVGRFDATNRLFLILVDKSNMFASWRLKKAKPLLANKINSYLDSVGSMPGKRQDFEWESQIYTTVSDILFVELPSD